MAMLLYLMMLVMMHDTASFFPLKTSLTATKLPTAHEVHDRSLIT
jgi:hypothetical protein